VGGGFCCVFFGGGWGLGGEMNQALYAHMNNKRKMKKKKRKVSRRDEEIVYGTLSLWENVQGRKILEYCAH
jgi:hypothetical protein